MPSTEQEAAAGGRDAGDDGDALPVIAKAVRPSEEVITLASAQGREEGDWTAGGKGKGKGGGKQPKERSDKGLDKKMEKYSRGKREKAPKGVAGDRKLSHHLRSEHKKNNDAIFRMAKSEVLQTEQAGFIEAEDDREWSSRLSQAQILEDAPVGVAKKRIQLNLPHGPYSCSFTRNGSHLLAGGRKGHIAFLHAETMHIMAELHVKETVRAVQTLHSQSLFAVAQKKYTRIYDAKGTEVHCLKEHAFPSYLDFLPYHFLLVSAGENSDLRYRDISTGQEVAAHKTRLGPTRSMRQNPRSGVMQLGHSNGAITMWTPSDKNHVVRMFAHHGQVSSVACNGDYMVTAGSEGKWKVWDMRKFEHPLHQYKAWGQAVCDIDISMTDMVAIGFGPRVHVWKDLFSAARPVRPYLTNDYNGQVVNSLRFRPYEDVLGVGHSGGFETMLVPGAGVANFDSREANPFENTKERRNREVKQLLDKLQPDTIMVDPDRIGSLNKELVQSVEKEEEAAREADKASKKKPKKKARGKNKIGRKIKRKTKEVGKRTRAERKEKIEGDVDGSSSEDEGEDDAAAAGTDDEADAGTEAAPKPSSTVGAALNRFKRKKTS